MSSISMNPVLTTNALNSFNTQSDGFIQGVQFDDPAARFTLAGGVLSQTEALPMWGGVGLSEFVPPNGIGGSTAVQLQAQGGQLTRATSVTAPTTRAQATTGQLTGFSVFNQDNSMVQTPQSPVPVALQGMGVNFVRLGSGARLTVAMDPVLVNLQGLLISSVVSWDYALQRLIPYIAAYPANVLTGSVWASTAGGQVTFTTTTSHGVTVGSDFTITGSIPTGYNGTYTAIAGTTGSTLVAALTTDPGSITTEGTLVAGGGALACKILDINVGNSMVVAYDAVTQRATWNRSGSAALILI